MCEATFFLLCTKSCETKFICTVSRAALSLLCSVAPYLGLPCYVTPPPPLPSCRCRSWSLKGDKSGPWLGDWWAGWRWCQLSVKSQRDECRWCRFIDQTLEEGWKRTGIVILITGPHLHLVCDLLMAGYVYWEQLQRVNKYVVKTHLVIFCQCPYLAPCLLHSFYCL